MTDHETIYESKIGGFCFFHQFINEIFLQTKLDQSIVLEAENKANLYSYLDQLKDCVLEGDQIDKSPTKTSSTICPDNKNTTANETDNLSTVANHSFDTTNNTANTSGQQYVSIAESMTENSPPSQQDETLYHSILNTSKTKETLLDCLQSLPIVARHREEIKNIVKEFDKDPLRAAVRSRASEVPIEEINEQTLKQLSNMFEDNITIEKIVTLFFFCADMASRAVQLQKRDLAVDILQWSFIYITKDVCEIVWIYGGWKEIVPQGQQKYFDISPTTWVIITYCAAVGFVYLLSKLNKSLRA